MVVKTNPGSKNGGKTVDRRGRLVVVASNLLHHEWKQLSFRRFRVVDLPSSRSPRWWPASAALGSAKRPGSTAILPLLLSLLTSSSSSCLRAVARKVSNLFAVMARLACCWVESFAKLARSFLWGLAILGNVAWPATVEAAALSLNLPMDRKDLLAG